MQFSINKIFYTAASIALLFCFIIFGAPILKPLVFALLLSIMLIPLQDFFYKRIPSKITSILLATLTVFLPLGAIISVFVMQAREVFAETESLTSIFEDGYLEIAEWINNKTPFQVSTNIKTIDESAIPDGFVSFISSGVSTTVNVITLTLLTILFMIFFMLYRDAFVAFIRMQFKKEHKHYIDSILQKVKKMLVSYLASLGIVMVLMAILNSLGLWIIGVDYPVFFGVLAAFLTIIPFVGTTLGGTLPFLFVLATGGGWLKAMAVVIFYFTIQQIEGNFITPKIVGDSVSVNPFIALVGITMGAYIWGVAGIVLAIPVLGLIRIVFNEIPPLKPIAILLSNKILTSKRAFKELDEPKYRLGSNFKIKNEEFFEQN